MKRVAQLICICAVIFFAAATQTSAASYDVSASVPAPIPSTPAVVETPGDNTAVTTQQTIISGTCPIVTPAVIVSIWRGDEIIGSGTCSPQGTFSIIVSLVLGSNYLVAKIQTITGDYGVIGTPITVFYIPSGSSNTDSSKNPTTVPALSVGFSSTFFTYNADKEFSLQFEIKGGKVPYKTIISWGDGNESEYTYDSAGVKTAIHVYKTVARYSLKVQVVDAAGQVANKSVAVVSLAIPADNDIKKMNITSSTKMPSAWVLLIGLMLIVVLVVMADRWFILGKKRRKKNKRDEPVAKRKVGSAKKRRPSRAKK